MNQLAWVVTANEAMTQRDEAHARAFEALFLAEYGRVHAIATRVGLDAAEAEDVAQEAFAQCYRRRLAGELFAAAWLRRAAAHLALNVIRSRRRRSAREDRDAAETRTSYDVQAASADPQAQAIEAERRRAVRMVMARLSRRHAAVLALRYSGMSYAQVGAALGVPPAHIGTLLRRAEVAFKREFDHATLG